jgi:hypothetical protein
MNALDSFCSWISEINTAVSVHVFVLVRLSMPVFTSCVTISPVMGDLWHLCVFVIKIFT